MSGEGDDILCEGSELCWQLYKNPSKEEKQLWVIAQETLGTCKDALAKYREERKERLLESGNKTAGEQTTRDKLTQPRWVGQEYQILSTNFGDKVRIEDEYI